MIQLVGECSTSVTHAIIYVHPKQVPRVAAYFLRLTQSTAALDTEKAQVDR